MEVPFDIRPAFNYESNTPIKIAEGLKAVLKVGQSECHGKCQVIYEPREGARVDLDCEFTDVDQPTEFMMVISGNENIQLYLNGMEIEGGVLWMDKLENGNVHLKWFANSSRIEHLPNDEINLSLAKFHLFNFSSIITGSVYEEHNDQVLRFRAVINLENHLWISKITATPDKTKNNRPDWGQKKELSLTHVGVLNNKNGEFSAKELIREIDCIKYALSFAVGEWIEPVCPVGYDHKQQKVWDLWSSPYDSTGKPLRWLDVEKGQSLTEMYPSFSRFWYDDNWQSTLKEVIYWYLHSNYKSVNIDAGIILTMTALERLSFQYAVSEKNLISSKGFKDLRGSDKLRLLFSSLQLPQYVSDETPDIKKFFEKNPNNLVEASFVLTEIRNSLVHPDNKNHGKTSTLYFEAWNLGQWYLELALLSLIGFQGTYLNRLKGPFGPSEHVPWKNDN